MKYTFQYYLDVSTSASSLQLIKIKAGGEYVRKRCKHLFNAYKYFKLGKLSVKMVPASTLPVDPLGLSYEDSDPNTVDPRDQLNPGLVRITNGENILTDFSDLTDEQINLIYTNTMLDPRWSKFMLQSGFKRSAVPLAWNIGNLQQSAYPDAVRNLPITTHLPNADADILDGTARLEDYIDEDSSVEPHTFSNRMDVRWGGMSDPRGIFQTGHRQRLSWLPTDGFQQFYVHKDNADKSVNLPLNTPIPSIDCITVILPKAYKTLYYYRLFITETVYFAGIKNVGMDGTGGELRGVDNFTFVNYPFPRSPKLPVGSNLSDGLNKHNDGGGNSE